VSAAVGIRIGDAPARESRTRFALVWEPTTSPAAAKPLGFQKRLKVQIGGRNLRTEHLLAAEIQVNQPSRSYS